jgi:hypothetical protein
VLVLNVGVSLQVQTLLGDGSGGFTSGPTAVLSDRTGLFGASAADVNGDGRLDLVLTDAMGNPADQIEDIVALGDGTGAFTFGPSSSVSTGGFRAETAVADLNGDGKLDLATTDDGASVVRVLLGNGDGSFVPGPVVSLPQPPELLAAGDFNGDRVPDLAVEAVIGPLDVFPGIGDGSFGRPVQYAAEFGELVPADYNLDGAEDLAVAGDVGVAATFLQSTH